MREARRLSVPPELKLAVKVAAPALGAVEIANVRQGHALNADASMDFSMEPDPRTRS